jgi:hypothetical protein
MCTANAREVVTAQPPYTGPAPEPALSADAKRALVSGQVSLVNQMADKFQAEAASQFHGNFDALEWRLAFGSRLFHQSEAALTAGLAAGDIATMNAKMASESMAKHAGTLQNTINLLPNPCRIVDTRFGGGGQLGPSARFWYASNTPAVIASQGGNPAGCGTYPDSEFFLVYVTVVPPGAPLSGGAGFLTLNHDGGTPTVATMNYYPGINIANFAMVSCNGCQGGTGGFYGYASNPTHVVIDLVGTGSPTAVAMYASILATGAISRGYFVTSSQNLGTGTYETIFNRDITACGFQATIGNPGSGVAVSGQISIQQRAGNANGVFVETRDSAGTVSNRPYYVTVNCP